MNTTQIENPQQLADLVRDCRAKNIPLVDYGKAHGDLGHRPPQSHVPFELQGDILEHYQRDLTVRTSAGITIGRLNEALKPTGQFCPINADDDLTLGEVIAHNIYGPMRVRYGAIRDLLLGLHYIDSHGEDIHVGGRTVKNVAGYDITRMMVGSLGELGIIYEATLRTYAIPAQVARVELETTDLSTLANAITTWMITEANPASTHLRRISDRWQLEICYFGQPTANDVQVAALRQATTGLTWIDEKRCDLTEQLNHWQQLRQWQRTSLALVKIITPPAATAQICTLLAEQGLAQITALPSHGCIFASMTDASQAEQLDPVILEQLNTLGGVRLWIRQPVDCTLAPFAPQQPDWPLATQLKRTLDPDNLLNPGRFLTTGASSS